MAEFPAPAPTPDMIEGHLAPLSPDVAELKDPRLTAFRRLRETLGKLPDDALQTTEAYLDFIADTADPESRRKSIIDLFSLRARGVTKISHDYLVDALLGASRKREPKDQDGITALERKLLDVTLTSIGVANPSFVQENIRGGGFHVGSFTRSAVDLEASFPGSVNQLLEQSHVTRLGRYSKEFNSLLVKGLHNADDDYILLIHARPDHNGAFDAYSDRKDYEVLLKAAKRSNLTIRVVEFGSADEASLLLQKLATANNQGKARFVVLAGHGSEAGIEHFLGKKDLSVDSEFQQALTAVTHPQINSFVWACSGGLMIARQLSYILGGHSVGVNKTASGGIRNIDNTSGKLITGKYEFVNSDWDDNASFLKNLRVSIFRAPPPPVGLEYVGGEHVQANAPTVAEFFDAALKVELTPEEIDHLTQVGIMSHPDTTNLVINSLLYNMALTDHPQLCIEALGKILSQTRIEDNRMLACRALASCIRYFAAGKKHVEFDLDLANPAAGTEVITLVIDPKPELANKAISELENAGYAKTYFGGGQAAFDGYLSGLIEDIQQAEPYEGRDEILVKLKNIIEEEAQRRMQ